MVKYIFSNGKVYVDDGTFSPIMHKPAPHFGSFGLLVLINEHGEPIVKRQGDHDV